MADAAPQPISTVETDAIRALIKSDGWQLLRQRMLTERDVFVSQLVANPAMSSDEIHWRRGVLWAADRLLQMPDLFLQQLENEFLLKTAKPRSE